MMLDEKRVAGLTDEVYTNTQTHTLTLFCVCFGVLLQYVTGLNSGSELLIRIPVQCGRDQKKAGKKTLIDWNSANNV